MPMAQNPAPRLKIGSFHSVLPQYHAPQVALAQRLALLHSRAIEKNESAQLEVQQALQRRIERFGCDPTRISQRYFEAEAFHPEASAEAVAFHEKTGWTPRMDLYRQATTRAFSEWYPLNGEYRRGAPDDIIHVSCTGYIAPSPAQELVARLDLGHQVRVTHAYHMGCYAALPALRIAEGLIRAGSAQVDIAHTELCTLHLQVGRVEPEQLVIQSLFGDGHIRWSLFDSSAPGSPSQAHFELLGHAEEIVPGSQQDMSWNAGETGWQMTLSRDVPEKIKLALPGFVARLLEPHGLKLSDCIGAVHPGGPKIIDEVAQALSFTEEQVRYSKQVLFERGNLSSATLPHIWEKIAEDPTTPDEQPVLSLAFGPGLTLCGALMLKRAGSSA
jgi:predicted naringenin-chalcone synthase